MPSLKKLLAKFTESERKTIESLLELIISLNWKNLNVKKLKGHSNVYRVRKRNLHIIFTKEKEGIFILAIDRRNDNTYKI